VFMHVRVMDHSAILVRIDRDKDIELYFPVGKAGEIDEEIGFWRIRVCTDSGSSNGIPSRQPRLF
jgi:hypothetical protein